MTVPDQADRVARNRGRQAELYGEPLADRFRRISDALGLNQARIAETVGLSPAMLSQLIGARRIKIGNPTVAQRIAALEELADAGAEGSGLDARLAEIRGTTLATTRTAAGTVRAGDRASVVRGLQDVLRSAASAQELLDAARLLEPDHPRLADVLRVYGTGRTADAMAHYEEHAG